MSSKKNRKQPAPVKNHKDSVFKEAWENMNEDIARVMPGFLLNRLQGSKGKVWVMIAVTVVELVVLGAVGKFAYDWFTK